MADAVVSPELRHRFARNICNRCHTQIETGPAFFQVNPRFPFQESQLSGFLLGADVTDFSAGVIRHFNELDRRGRVLHDFVCPDEMLPPPPPATTPLGGQADGGFPPPLDGGFTGTAGAIGGRDAGSSTGAAGAPGK